MEWIHWFHYNGSNGRQWNTAIGDWDNHWPHSPNRHWRQWNIHMFCLWISHGAICANCQNYLTLLRKLNIHFAQFSGYIEPLLICHKKTGCLALRLRDWSSIQLGREFLFETMIYRVIQKGCYFFFTILIYCCKCRTENNQY